MALSVRSKILALDAIFPSHGKIRIGNKSYIWIPEPLKGLPFVHVCDSPDAWTDTYSHTMNLNKAYKFFVVDGNR